MVFSTCSWSLSWSCDVSEMLCEVVVVVVVVVAALAVGCGTVGPGQLPPSERSSDFRAVAGKRPYKSLRKSICELGLPDETAAGRATRSFFFFFQLFGPVSCISLRQGKRARRWDLGEQGVKVKV